MSNSRAAKFVGSASEVAHYYGFRHLLEIAPEYASKARSIAVADAAAAIAGRSGSGEPVLAFYAAYAAGERNAAMPPRETGEFSLQIVGCPSSIGEIHLLKTLEAIVAENGGTVAYARINSLGDRDSRARFARELGNFLRRHAGELESILDAPERARITENPLYAYRVTILEFQNLMREAPRPVHYLSEKSRAHFRQVLEHLERINFPYLIDDLLITPALRSTSGDEGEARVMFCVEFENDAGVLTASIGGRYDDLATRPGVRAVPVVHASLQFRTKAPLTPTAVRASSLHPKVYFIQFGDSAKLSGFSVLDTLRRARVPVGSQFDARHLAPQLSAAQSIGVSYVLIMGAREALDQTVIVRTLATSAQTTVPIGELPKHLRALKLV